MGLGKETCQCYEDRAGDLMETCLEGLDIRPSYRIMCSADIRDRHRRAAARM